MLQNLKASCFDKNGPPTKLGRGPFLSKSYASMVTDCWFVTKDAELGKIGSQFDGASRGGQERAMVIGIREGFAPQQNYFRGRP